MFNFASFGTYALNFHGGIGQGDQSTMYYTPIYYSSPYVQIPEVRPLYYGMYLFAQTTRENSVVISPTVTTTDNLIKTWTVYDQVNNSK